MNRNKFLSLIFVFGNNFWWEMEMFEVGLSLRSVLEEFYCIFFNFKVQDFGIKAVELGAKPN